MADIDIVIPVYNSSKTLGALIKRLNEWHEESKYSVRVIFVDDASTDDSKKIILQEYKKFEFKLLELASNYGQHTATAVGIKVSKAALVATIDDDLQNDPFELEKLIGIQKQENADLVYGIYTKKKHSFIRNIGTILLKKILYYFGLDFNDVTSFRLFKSSIAKQFKEINYNIVFIDAYFKNFSSKQASCIVNHYDRSAGDSKYTYWKLMKFSINIILYHSSIPLRFITRFGLLMSFLFFIFGCYFIYNKMFYNVPLGYTSLIVAIFFSTGMIMMSLGIIGEYIRKIWISQKKLDQIILIENDSE
jgi:glycosyltransferase involved in cell wall biosynthesis